MQQIIVKIPEKCVLFGGTKDGKYVYYTIKSAYNPKTQNNKNDRVIIGKEIKDKPGYMQVNKNYFKYFSQDISKEAESEIKHSYALNSGLYFVVKSIVAKLGIDKLLTEIFEEKADLILSLVLYNLATGKLRSQHFESWNYGSVSFLETAPSQGTISRLFNEIIDLKDIDIFLQSWVNTVYTDKKNGEVLVALDSTNMNVNSPGIDIAEYGKPKVDEGLKQVNLMTTVDVKSELPLFYSTYPGSINDQAHFSFALKDAKDYHLKNLTFVLDRGYYSQKNMNFIKENGYNYIYMAKSIGGGMDNLFEKYRSTIKDRADFYLDDHQVYGLRVKDQNHENNFQYIFYSTEKQYSEYKTITTSFNVLLNDARQIKKPIDEHTFITYQKYLDLELNKDRTIKKVSINKAKMQEEIDKAGYYFMVSSKALSESEILSIYKKRDLVEKFFRNLKTELSLSKMYAQNSNPYVAKIFIGFISLIVKSYINTAMKESRIGENETMKTVFNELEKIQLLLRNDYYSLMFPFTRKQKEILKAIGVSEKFIEKVIVSVNKRYL